MVKNLEAYQIHKENCGGLTWRRKTKGHVVEEELASRAENQGHRQKLQAVRFQFLAKKEL